MGVFLHRVLIQRYGIHEKQTPKPLGHSNNSTLMRIKLNCCLPLLVNARMSKYLSEIYMINKGLMEIHSILFHVFIIYVLPEGRSAHKAMQLLCAISVCMYVCDGGHASQLPGWPILPAEPCPCYILKI